MSFDTEAVLAVFFLVNAEEKKSATLSLDLRIVWLLTTRICHFYVLFRIKLRPSGGFEQKTGSHVRYRDKMSKGKRDTCCLEDWRGRIKPQIYTLCGPESVGSQGSDGRIKENSHNTTCAQQAEALTTEKREITWLSLLSTQAENISANTWGKMGPVEKGLFVFIATVGLHFLTLSLTTFFTTPG